MHKSRLLASGIHFISSLIIIGALVAIVIVVWYPQPYFSASGGWQGLRIVALVDLVLGPLITLAIFDTKKPKKVLVQDLGIIVILQFAALFYGINTIYEQRPVALAYYEEKFYTIAANDLEEQGIDLQSLQQFSEDTPAMVYIEKPVEIVGMKAMLEMIKTQHIPPIFQLNLYRPIKTYLPTILKEGLDINKVISYYSGIEEQLASFLEESNGIKESYKYILLESKYQNLILIFNDQAEMVGYLKAFYKNASE